MIRNKVLTLSLVALLIAPPIIATADSKLDATSKLLTQYDLNIYQYANDLTALEMKMDSSSGCSAETILGIDNNYKNTVTKLKQEVQDKNAIAQQNEKADSEKVAEFRKLLISDIDSFGNVSNLSYPVTGEVTLVGTYGERLDSDDLRSLYNADDILLYVPSECEVQSQFNGKVTASEGSSVTIKTCDITMVYSNLGKIDVKVGDTVKQGQIIGMTGRNSMDWPCVGIKLLYKDTPMNPRIIYQ